MTYQGRVVIAGNYEGKPFAGFILASRSEPDRSLLLDIDKNKVWVSPGESLKQKLAEKPFEAVDDLYACIIGFCDKNNDPYAVAFNGRMSNRVEAMMKIGQSPESAMENILSVFPPIENDPRIGVIVGLEDFIPSYCIGVYDRKGGDFIMVNKTSVTPNQAKYISLTDPRNIKELPLKKSWTKSLAQQLYEEILGIPAEFGCGSAICLINGTELRFGVYNRK